MIYQVYCGNGMYVISDPTNELLHAIIPIIQHSPPAEEKILVVDIISDKIYKYSYKKGTEYDMPNVFTHSMQIYESYISIHLFSLGYEVSDALIALAANRRIIISSL